MGTNSHQLDGSSPRCNCSFTSGPFLWFPKANSVTAPHPSFSSDKPFHKTCEEDKCCSQEGQGISELEENSEVV